MQAHRLDIFPGQDIIVQYRNTFRTGNGPQVLAHILYELGIFEDTPQATPEDAALKAYAARLLTIIGGGVVSLESIKEFTQRLISQPLPANDKEDL